MYPDLFLMRRLAVRVCLILLLAASVAAGATQFAFAEPSADQARALELLNSDRAKNGLAPLVYNAELTKLAEEYARDMIRRQFFAHNNPEGFTPFDRMNHRGVAYRHAGENLAVNDSADAAQRAFMDSPTHRANVLNTDFTEIGIAVERVSNGKVYVVQEFIGH